MAGDPIVSVAVHTASLSLAEPFEHASSGLIESLEEVVVEVRTRSGAIGWGEVRGNAPYVTGETQARVVASLCDLLAPALARVGLSTIAEIGAFVDRLAVGNSTAKAAIDIAVHDARARAIGVGVQDLLGGGGVRTLPVHGSLPFCAPDEAARRASRYLDLGIRTIKVRVGLSASADLARLEAVAEALAAHPKGAGARLAVDANQAWSVTEAARRLRTLERFDLAWIEQPVAAADIRGMSELRTAASAPLVADESCGSAGDLMRIVEARAADAVHLKLCKAGGIRKLMAKIAIAEAAGLAYLVGQMDEGMLATAAGLHCAAASRPMSCELWGFQRVGSQPFRGLEMVDGAVRFPDAPGLGIEVETGGLTEIARFEADRP